MIGGRQMIETYLSSGKYPDRDKVKLKELAGQPCMKTTTICYLSAS